MTIKKLITYPLLASITFITSSAEEATDSFGTFGLTGGYDTRLGDQWGLLFLADSFMMGFSFGGFIYSDAANQASNDTNAFVNSRYGDDPGIEGDAFTYSFYIAGIGNPEAYSSFYYGVGFSGAHITVSYPDFEKVDASGELDDFLVDFFVDLTGHSENGLFYDLRLGYGYSMEFSGEVEVSGDGRPDLNFAYEGGSFLEGIYDSASIRLGVLNN